jgi:hypothetical protein
MTPRFQRIVGDEGSCRDAPTRPRSKHLKIRHERHTQVVFASGNLVAMYVCACLVPLPKGGFISTTSNRFRHTSTKATLGGVISKQAAPLCAPILGLFSIVP